MRLQICMQEENFTVSVPEYCHGKRLDQALAALCPQHSRARLQAWIKNGFVSVDGALLKQKDSVRGGQRIVVQAPLESRNPDWVEQAIPVDILHEDEDLILVNKAAGLVTHPGAGNPDRTLVNALLFHCPELARLPRAGIVQRLDKDTSGIMVVAKSLRAHTRLTRDLQRRTIIREYRALAHGCLLSGGAINAAIGRHPTRRTRMAVTASGRPAVTHYRIIRRYPVCTWLSLRLETGRTHQIRVHLHDLGHPVVGDPVYHGGYKLPRAVSPALREKFQTFPRQALHATRLTLRHPADDEQCSWRAPLPADMEDLLAALRLEFGP